MIWFNVPGPRAFLACNGYVYTLRKRGRKTGADKAVTWNRGKLPNEPKKYYPEIEDIADVNIKFVKNISGHGQLRPWVKESGIGLKNDAEWDRAKEWFELALKLHRGKPMALYMVRKID